MTDDEFVAAVAARVEELELRDQAEHEARHHVRWAIDALFAGYVDDARQRVRWARGALDVWHQIRPDEPLPDLTDERARVYRMRRKRLGRLNYWYDERINLWMEDFAQEGHVYLSRQAEADFAEHPEAIFAYARQDARAFQAPWVIRQIEQWNHERDSASLQKLMRAYRDARGKPMPAEALARQVATDQATYRRYRTALVGAAHNTAAIDTVAGTDDHDSAKYKAVRKVCEPYDECLAVYRSHFPTATETDFLDHLSALLDTLKAAASR